MDDWVDLGDDQKFNLGNNATISTWVKTSNAGSWKWIFQYGEHASARDRSLAIDSSDKARMYVYGTNAISTTSVTDGRWHHLVGTLDGTTSKIYVNGVLEDAQSPTLNTYTYTGARIGRNVSTPYWFNGLIDEVRIYNYALTDEQIKLLYNDGAAIKFGN